MSDIKDKIIREDDAIATIEFRDGISEDIAKRIDKIISKNYDQECDFIIKLDRNHYKGDMACLSGLGNHVLKDLNLAGLKNVITVYEIYNERTDEHENFLED